MYKEFRSHFTLMGEKSFDHSKKFWFNKLRKQYVLREDTVAASQPKGLHTTTPNLNDDKADVSKDAPQAPKPAGFKPRFKGTSLPKPADPDTTEPIIEKGETSAKPSGFKPRFNAAKLKKADTKDDATDQHPLTPPEDALADKDKAESSTEESPEKPLMGKKPTGFTPRFKAGVTKKTEPPSEENAASKPEEAKPLGFKPRFKAGVTKTEKHIEENQGTDKPEEDKPTAKQTQETPAKPLGFKPRFKSAGKGQSPDAADSEQEQKSKEDNSEGEQASKDDTPKSKPVGFTPRFKKKND